MKDMQHLKVRRILPALTLLVHQHRLVYSYKVAHF